MAKKKTAEIVDEGLTEEEQAVMYEQQEEAIEVVSEEEAQSDEALSTDDVPKVEAEEKPKVEEPAEEPKAEEPKPEPTTVPLAALDSERHKRKEAEGRLAVLEDKMTTLMAPKPAEPPAEDKMPDPVVDPEGFEGWLVRRDARNAQPVQQMTEQMRQQQERADLMRFIGVGETTFRAENNDYDVAFEYAKKSKASEFRSYGFSEEQIPALVEEAAMQVSALARHQGKNPAQVIYDYAKLTGYMAAASPSEANAELLAESPGDKLARLEKTQKTTQSTAGAGGTAREDEWTAERIAALSDKEMAALPDDVFERVMGG